MTIVIVLSQAAASTTPSADSGLPFSPGSGGLPDLSSLFGAAMGSGSGAGGTGPGGSGGMGLGGMGLGSPNLAEMQRQVCPRFSQQSFLIILNEFYWIPCIYAGETKWPFFQVELCSGWSPVI